MSYIIDDRVVVTDQSSTQLVDFDTFGNITTIDSYGFRKNNNTVTWALNNNQPTTYEIVYPQTNLSNNQGLIITNTTVTVPRELTSYFLEAPNMRIVRSNPAPGQYTSVRSAVASISGSTLANPFTVWVQPGVYVETNFTPITLPIGVFVSGFGPGETVLVDHKFEVTGVANPGSFGLNNATFKRVNQSVSNTFLDVTSSTTLGLILDSQFEDWKRLFTVSSSQGTTLKIGGISTSANSTIFPNMIANITYTSTDTGANVEINRSSFVLDSSGTPFSVFGNASVLCGGGFNLRNNTFRSTSFADRDFLNATSFNRMILKNLDISGYSNIITVSGLGLNGNSNSAAFFVSDIHSLDHSILFQDSSNFVASYAHTSLGMANFNATVFGNKTDLNKIFVKNQQSRLPIVNLDDCREFHIRDIPIFEDFTSGVYPYIDLDWELINSGTANITNAVPTLNNDSVVNGFGTVSLQTTNDGFVLSSPVAGYGVDMRYVQYINLGAGITVYDPVGVGNTTTMFGLGDSNSVVGLTTNNSTSNGIYFSYSPSTALFPSTFNCIYKTGANIRIVDSGVPVSNGVYYNLDVEYRRLTSNTETKFYINEQLVGYNFTSSLFTTQLYPMFKFFANNGAGSWSIDYIHMNVRTER